jgi:transposase
MKAYSEDLREKIASAVERGRKKSEIACTFGVRLSAVKRYAALLLSERLADPEEETRQVS